MIANRGLKNSAATAATGKEENAENEMAQEDRKPLGCGKCNNLARLYLIITTDMYNVLWQKNILY